MSWKDILKQITPINELIDGVHNKLDEEFMGKFVIDYGDYDEEMEGYRDASDFTFETYRGRNESVYLRR